MRPMPRPLPAFFLSAFLAAPGIALAQAEPLGPEFRVNTYTPGRQNSASVASDAAGNFVVVWEANDEGSQAGIFAQRYDSAGSALGGEFRVNTYTTGTQWRPAAAYDPAGNFTVVWQGPGRGDMDGGIFARRYDSTGAPLGGQFRVNTRTWSSQADPAVASDAAGNIVIAWAALGHQSTSGGDIFAQRYDATPGCVHLFRPDQHLTARWRHLDLNAVRTAVSRAACLRERQEAAV